MKIELKNFRCYEDKVFEFDDGDITQISGKSGAGKSTIFEAIMFVLYDLRKPYSIGKKDCQVKFDINMNEDSKIKIIRRKSPNILKITINDKSFEGDIAQTKINDIFGSKEIFLSSQYLRQSERHPFLTGDISILSNMLNVDNEDLLEKIKYQMKNISQILIKYRTEVEVLKSNIVEVRCDIECDIEELEKKVSKLRSEYAESENFYSMSKKIVNDDILKNLRNESKEIEEQLLKRPIRNFDQEKQKFLMMKDEIENKVRKNGDQTSLHNFDLNELKKFNSIFSRNKCKRKDDIILKLEKLTSNETSNLKCPVCKSSLKFEENHLIHIKEQNEDEILQLRKDIMILSDMSLTHDEIKSNISKLEEYERLKMINFDEGMDFDNHRKLKDRLSHIRDIMSLSKTFKDRFGGKTYRSLRDIRNDISQNENLIKLVNQKKSNDNIKIKIDSLSLKISELSQKEKLLISLKNKIKKAESLFIQSFVDDLNLRLVEISSYLFDNLKITLETSKTSKISKNERIKFNLSLIYKDEEYDVNMFSGGELSRISICLTFVLAKMLNRKFILMDETISNLDNELKEKIIDILNSSKITTLLISHDLIDIEKIIEL